MKPTTKSLSPLTEATLYTLISLVEPLHGYGIIKKVEEMSQRRVLLSAGTLYGVINSLLENQLIQLIGEETVQNKTRKIYQITENGRHLIHTEILRLTEIIDNAQRAIGGSHEK